MSVPDGPHAVRTRADEYYPRRRAARRSLVGNRARALFVLYLGHFCSFRPETIRIEIAALESYSLHHARRSTYTFGRCHRRARRVGRRQLPVLACTQDASRRRSARMGSMPEHGPGGG